MTKNLLRVLLAVILLGGTVHAQEKLTIDQVYNVTLRNSGTIVADGQIKGYYFFYQSDKIDKHTNEYALQIVDANLNTLNTVKMQDDKHIVLLESSYNGGALMFAFYNDDEKTLTYRTFGTDGKKTFEYSKVLDKRSNKYFKLALGQDGSDEETQNDMLYNVANRGFMSLVPLREDKNYTYEINYYGSDRRRSWTFNPAETGKFQKAQFLGTNDSIAIFEVLSRERLMSKENESTLLGIDMATGRKVFETRTQDGKNQLYPMNVAPVAGTNNFLVIGPYYEGNDRVMADKTKGLGIWLLDSKGKLVQSKYNPYETSLGKYVPVSKRGQVADLGYLYIHKVLQTGDGRFFAVAEGYHKAADGLGIAMAALSRGRNINVTKLVITDMLLIEMNDKFEVTNTQIYDKKPNDFSINGGDFVNAHTLALLARTLGYFDYRFTQTGKNAQSFTSGYMDIVKDKEYKGLVFKTISYVDGKISNDQIKLNSKSSDMSVQPAKQGFIMVAEYIKKEKKMEVRLEKIN